MPRFYASIISPDKAALAATARVFSHTIEMTEDGVLFDVSGLERLIGKPERIAEKISHELEKNGISASVAVAETVETATLLARQNGGQSHKVHSPEGFQRLPLTDLAIEQDTINVLNDLGLRHIEDVLAIPHTDLIARYGQGFQTVIDALEQKGTQLLTPNVKETEVSWEFHLDNAVEDFEQLIFIVNHGLDHLFRQVAHFGHSTEHIDITFNLGRSPQVCRSPHDSKGLTLNLEVTPLLTCGLLHHTKTYEIKTSFPTLERSFWLKLINLRISLDPPETAIRGINVVAHFTKARTNQRGLYSASRPEPESLLLTVGKLKKLVGEMNVGVPVLINQRMAEPFDIVSDAMPLGIETFQEQVKPAVFDRVYEFPNGGRSETARSTGQFQNTTCSTIAFVWYRPPIPAEVLVRDGRLVYVKTRRFTGHILASSGVWKGNSHWWDKPWRTQEWDIQVENNGLYRLCKSRDEWFVTGEYD